jgi:hypothetical protein
MNEPEPHEIPMMVPVVDYVPGRAGIHTMLPRRSFLHMAGAGLGFFAANVHKKIFAMFFGDEVTGERTVPILTAMENALLAFHNTGWVDCTVTLCAKDHDDFTVACGDFFGKATPKAVWYSSGIGDVLVQKAVPGGKTKIDTNWDHIEGDSKRVFCGLYKLGFSHVEDKRAMVILPSGDFASVKLTELHSPEAVYKMPLYP